jgi:DNA-binding NtrC family response regulator
VLVVDDDPRMRDLLTLLLRFSKFEVLCAANPAEAMAAVRDRPDIALVIADIVLPDISGYDLADEIKKTRPEMRMVFMSGFAADALRRVVDAPCLAKPFTVDELLGALDQAMKGAG